MSKVTTSGTKLSVAQVTDTGTNGAAGDGTDIDYDNQALNTLDEKLLKFSDLRAELLETLEVYVSKNTLTLREAVRQFQRATKWELPQAQQYLYHMSGPASVFKSVYSLKGVF